MSEQIESILTSKLEPSSFTAQVERREHYDQAALLELAENIKQVGMVQPIVARRVSDARYHGSFYYEIVAGERRWLAAQKAGLETVPVWIRDLNDQQALEVQLVENLQREGLHELAEAEGYETLMKQHGYDVEQLVAKVGKSRSYVYGRLKLLALGKQARDAFYKGAITGSHALLLARIPVLELQEQALEEVLAGRGWRDDDEPMSVREAARHIAEKYTTRLDQAPFSTSDPDLVPDAGACSSCPKRTGNQPELFGDIKSADVCTDTQCFAAKREASAAIKIAQAKANGQKVITGKQAKQLAPHGVDYGIGGGYVKLDARNYDDPKNRTYRQLLGKSSPAPTLLEDPREKGKLIEVLDRKTLDSALKAAGFKRPKNQVTKSPQQKAAEQRAKIDQAVRDRITDAIRPKVPSKLGGVELEVLARAVYDRMWSEAQKRLRKYQNLEPSDEELAKAKSSYGPGSKEDLRDRRVRDFIADASSAELSRFLMDCVLSWTAIMYDEDEDPLPRLADAYDIDVETIRKEVTAELAEKTALPAPKKKAPAKKKAAKGKTK